METVQCMASILLPRLLQDRCHVQGLARSELDGHVDGFRLTLPPTASVCMLQDVLPADVPIVSVSKGLEVGTGKMMSELIVDVLGRKHPCCFLSGPSFAKEVMTLQPTGVVAASKVHIHTHTQCSLHASHPDSLPLLHCIV